MKRSSAIAAREGFIGRASFAPRRFGEHANHSVQRPIHALDVVEMRVHHFPRLDR